VQEGKDSAAERDGTRLARKRRLEWGRKRRGTTPPVHSNVPMTELMAAKAKKYDPTPLAFH